MMCDIVAYLYHIGDVPVERDNLIQDWESNYRNNVLRTGREKQCAEEGLALHGAKAIQRKAECMGPDVCR